MLRDQEPDDGKRGDGATRISPRRCLRRAARCSRATACCAESATTACVAEYGSPVPDPQLSLGPHLAYTVQWYALAILAPLGVVVMLARGAGPRARRRPRGREGRCGGAGRRGGAGRPDEEIEDALYAAG